MNNRARWVRLSSAVAYLLAVHCGCTDGRSAAAQHQKLPSVSQLISDLKSRDVAARRQAAQLLNSVDPDSIARQSDGVESALERALQDEDPQVGDLAATAFALIRSEGHLLDDQLGPLVNSRRPEVARRAVVALRMAGCHASRAAEGVRILERPNASSAERLRAIALVDRGGTGSGYEMSLIARACDDPSPKVRRAALKTLKNGGYSFPPYDLLVALAKDKDPGVRCAALEDMGGTLDPRFLDAVRPCRQDPDAQVAGSARRAYTDCACNLGILGAVSADQKKKQFRFLDLRIGYFQMFGNGEDFCIDSSRGLFLARGGEGSGAHKRLAFASEPGALGIADDMFCMIETPLGGLKTGRGIALGELRPLVRAALGKPTRIRQEAGRALEIYTCKYDGDEYRATYSYRGDRLVGVLFTLDDPDAP